ncbi:MAG: flavodoxin [Candidatus Omnitrophota bacterium]
MKTKIIFYSYSGNTRKVASVLSNYLKEKNYEVDFIDLEALDESNSFLGQCRRAFSKTKALIKETNFDLANYDLICISTPIWAFKPAPAVNTFLDKCFNLENKKIILFSTYGSGTGNTKCLNYMEDLLKKKGAKEFARFSVQQFKVKDIDFIRDLLLTLNF